jgi:hypothetical protein
MSVGKAIVFGGLAIAGLIAMGAAGNAPSREDVAEKANPTCKSDWKLCKSNLEVILTYKYGHSWPQHQCLEAAKRSAKFGTPVFPDWWKAFDKLALQQPAELGTVRLLEDDAQYQNGFGAMAHVQVVCDYSFASDNVVNIQINN